MKRTIALVALSAVVLSILLFVAYSIGLKNATLDVVSIVEASKCLTDLDRIKTIAEMPIPPHPAKQERISKECVKEILVNRSGRLTPLVVVEPREFNGCFVAAAERIEALRNRDPSKLKPLTARCETYLLFQPGLGDATETGETETGS